MKVSRIGNGGGHNGSDQKINWGIPCRFGGRGEYAAPLCQEHLLMVLKWIIPFKLPSYKRHVQDADMPL